MDDHPRPEALPGELPLLLGLALLAQGADLALDVVLVAREAVQLALQVALPARQINLAPVLVDGLDLAGEHVSFVNPVLDVVDVVAVVGELVVDGYHPFQAGVEGADDALILHPPDGHLHDLPHREGLVRLAGDQIELLVLVGLGEGGAPVLEPVQELHLDVAEGLPLPGPQPPLDFLRVLADVERPQDLGLLPHVLNGHLLRVVVHVVHVLVRVVRVDDLGHVLRQIVRLRVDPRVVQQVYDVADAGGRRPAPANTKETHAVDEDLLPQHSHGDLLPTEHRSGPGQRLLESGRLPGAEPRDELQRGEEPLVASGQIDVHADLVRNVDHYLLHHLVLLVGGEELLQRTELPRQDLLPRPTQRGDHRQRVLKVPAESHSPLLDS